MTKFTKIVSSLRVHRQQMITERVQFFPHSLYISIAILIVQLVPRVFLGVR